MSSLSSSGGGGGAIYKDGEPVFEYLNAGESITVPAGETWIVSTDNQSSSSADTLLNGEVVANENDNNVPNNFNREDLPLAAGDTISLNGSSNKLQLWGWAV